MELTDGFLDARVASRSRTTSRCTVSNYGDSKFDIRTHVSSIHFPNSISNLSVKPRTDVLIENTKPDGGWGWLCVLGSFIASFLIGGIEKSFGLLFPIIEEEYECSAIQASWAGSLSPTLRLICGVFAGFFVNKYGCRLATFIGAIAVTSGLVASSFAPNIWLLDITYGLFPGVGGCMIYLSSTLILNDYFDDKRARATGIALSGSGMGAFCMPLFIQFLLDEYGFRGTILIISGLASHFFLTATLYRCVQSKKDCMDNISDCSDYPSDENIPKYKQAIQCLQNHFGCMKEQGQTNSASLKFLILCASIGFVFMGYLASLFFLPQLAKSQHIESSRAALLLSIIGISDMVGRLTSGVIFDMPSLVERRRQMYSITFLALAAVNGALPFCTEYYHFIMCSVCLGYFAGVCIAQRAVICVDLVGEESLQSAYGILLTCQGIGVLIGPAIASGLQAHYDSLAASYFFCCAVQLIAGGLFSADVIAHTYKLSRLP